MKVLVACEFSGIVRDAFIKCGHNAISCDILPTEKPGPHIQGDVLEILNDNWDLVIAHPPCTFLCLSGARWLYTTESCQCQKDPERWDKMREAAKFFSCFLEAKCEKIAIENPIQHKHSKLPKYNQIIQPWQFGEEKQKSTCLWLKNLPLLKPTNIVDKGEFITLSNGGRMAKWYADLSRAKKASHIRSITFQGIADAMAEQWGALL